MPQAGLSIRPDRLKTLLESVNRFGFNAETGGFNRPGFSDEDLGCRAWFAEEMRKDGLAVWSDGAGNLFGRFGPEGGSCVMAGSHLDTVQEGGAFDGSLGVCVALECVRTMIDAGLDPTTAIEVVATSEEEGRFGGMLGTQAIAGQITADWIKQAADADGKRLFDVMTAQGFEPLDILSAARQEGSIKAFLELHIEQGPVLEQEQISVGIADQVSGVCFLEIAFDGMANHSGTTPMTMRADAFAGLADLAQQVPQIIGEAGTDQTRITIGHVTLEPNHPHTIPGKAHFSVILRDTSEPVMRTLRNLLLERAFETAGKFGLEMRSTERSWLAPVHLDQGLADRLETLAEDGGLDVKRMSSGAGHDAQTMQAVCPSGLIFVPSRNGVSHSPDEQSEWPDIERGANLFLQALIDLTA